MTTLATETWTGTTGAAWPAQWTSDGGTQTIQANAGQMVCASGATAESSLLSMTATSTFDITGTFKVASGSTAQPAISVGGRGFDYFTLSGYMLRADYSTPGVQIWTTDSAGTGTNQASAAFTFTVGTTYNFRFRRFGGVISGRVWTGTEPTAWTVQWTDTLNLAAGRLQLSSANGPNTVTWDDLAVADVPAARAVRSNTAEGGTNATTVTTGNSGGASGDAWDLVSIPAGAITYTTTGPWSGSLAYAFTFDTTSSQGPLLRWGDALGLSAAAVRFYVFLPASLPTVAVNLVHITCNNGGTFTKAGNLVIDTSGRFVLQNSAGTNLFAGSSALPTGQWLRFEFAAAPGTSTSNGQIAGGWAVGDAAFTESFTSTATVNAATGPVGRVQIGKLSGTWSGAAVRVDSIAVSDSLALLGPSSTGATLAGTTAAATSSAPAGTVTATRTVTLAGATASATVTAPAGTAAVVRSVTLAGATAAVTTAAFAGPVGLVTPPSHLPGTADLIPAPKGTAALAVPLGTATVAVPLGTAVLASSGVGTATIATT